MLSSKSEDNSLKYLPRQMRLTIPPVSPDCSDNLSTLLYYTIGAVTGPTAQSLKYPFHKSRILPFGSYFLATLLNLAKLSLPYPANTFCVCPA